MDVHLDLIGGLAGDMFIAAMLDLRPDLEPGLQASIAACGLVPDVACRLVAHDDGVLVGRRFLVEQGGHRHEHHHHHGDDDHATGRHHADHDHTAWRDIRAGLQRSALDEPVKRHAIGIFTLLAEAEGRVHGVAPDVVMFHEVGAWDSIADIVGAAHIIASLGVSRWTTSAVPLGSGRVRTAHGSLPVPAPATALLLEGFATIADGVPGERVTPTGAAILRYLCGSSAVSSSRPRKLGGSGVGFGTKVFAGLSNCVRVLSFEDSAASRPGSDEVAVVVFEIDDMSGEELAHALDHLRGEPGVHDVLQIPAYGKKGRMVAHIQLLADPDALDAVIAACFRETATIGLRYSLQQRSVLPRRHIAVGVAGGETGDRLLKVKIVDRVETKTAKAEADEVAHVPSLARRRAMRRAAEQSALEDNE